MYPSKHLIYGILFGGFLYFLFPQFTLKGFFIFLAATTLIDGDHYLDYIIRKKDLNPKKAVSWFYEHSRKNKELPLERRENVYHCYYSLHGFEILLLTYVLSFLNKIFFFIFIGFAFHLLLDLIYQTTYFKNRCDKISIIRDILKFKKLTFIEDEISK